MTQTSDGCPNNGSDGGVGNSSRTAESESVGVVDHDKKEMGKGIDVSICTGAKEVLQESAAAVVMKVSQEVDSTQISENSNASGIFPGDNTTTVVDTTSYAPVTSNIPAAENGASTLINGVVAEMSISDDTENLTLSSSSSSSHISSKAPMCAICLEPCICYCKSCKKVSYCSKDHQKRHWKQHRPDCYPVTIQINSVFGSHLVVTRDVKRGEVILCEKPLLSAPFVNHFDHNELNASKNSKESIESPPQNCLVCLSTVENSSSTLPSSSFSVSPSETTTITACSKCRWPICCLECEKHPIHADQECKIFAEYHVEPSALCDMDAQFMCVALLRILLHKKEWDLTSSSSSLSTAAVGSSKWSQFMDVVNKQMPMKDGLNSQLAEAKKATARFSDLIRKSLGPIIYSEFSITDAEIDQIVRTLRTSSFITDNDGNYINGFSSGFSFTNNKSNIGHDSDYKITNCKNISRSCSRSCSNSGKFLTVYHLASMLTSNCVPNASWVIQQPSLDFYLRASTPIKTGERITITFVDPLLGTQERRELLWKEKYLSCSCSRCSDPTESCTFFSAIKCPSKKMGKEQAMVASKNGCDGGGGVICECEGYVLPTDPLAVTYTSLRSSCFCCSAAGATTQVVEVRIPSQRDDSPPRETLCEEERTVEWKCNVCLTRQPLGFVENSLERMRSIFMMEQGQNNDCFTRNIEDGECGSNANIVVSGGNKQEENVGSPASPNDLEELEARVDKIDSLVGNVAHANHCYILKKENEILTGISELMEKGQVPFDEIEKWAVRMIELSKKGLKVVNILCPGINPERGRLLYFLHQGLIYNLLFKTSRAMRVTINPLAETVSSNKSVNSKEVLSHEELMKKFYEVILARKEILEIFAMTKDNSRENEMLKAVQQDSIEIRLLKKYFKSHQNVNLSTGNIINVKT